MDCSPPVVSVKIERGGSSIAAGSQHLPVDGGGLSREPLCPLFHPELPDVLEMRLLLRHCEQQVWELRSVSLVAFVSETRMAHWEGSDLPGGVTQQLMKGQRIVSKKWWLHNLDARWTNIKFQSWNNLIQDLSWSRGMSGLYALFS